MAIEDFEWDGVEQEALPTPPKALEASSALQSWLARLKKSVWLEPALRLLGMTLLLGVLAGIGVVATTYAKPGLQLPEGSRVLADALGTSWLKPSSPSERAPASSHAGVASSGVAAPSAGHAAGSPAGAGAAPAEAPSGAAPSDSSPAEAPSGAAPSGITADGKVILNLASAEELTKLPGVGMKRATAIVALRVKLKRFKHATDLLRVKGIGPRGLQRMLPHLVLDAPLAS